MAQLFGEFDNGSSGFSSSAPIGKRIAAGVIDIVVVQLFVLALIKFAHLGGTINILVSVIYFFTRDNLLSGGIGKQLLKLKVTKEDGGDIEGDWKVAILHNLIIAIFPIAEVIMILVTGKSIGERIAKTMVIELT